MTMKNFFLFLLPVAVLVGCTTVSSYTPKAEPGPAQAKDYPIYVYNEKKRVPRPFEVIGTMTIKDTPFTMFGGSLEGEMKELRDNARRKGADALRITSLEQPGFLHAKYRITADFLRFTTEWESLELSEEEFRAYLTTKKETLDPIEGFWSASDAMRSRVGIVRNDDHPSRDFFAFILSTNNPTWQRGDKKLELVGGERPGVYRGIYYFDDYSRQAVAFTLTRSRTNMFVLPMPDDNPPIIFTKE
jgi:uncharacterized protein YceK